MVLFEMYKKESWLISDSDPGWAVIGEPDVTYEVYQACYYCLFGFLNFKRVKFLSSLSGILNFEDAQAIARNISFPEMLNTKIGYIDRKNNRKPRIFKDSSEKNHF